MNQTLAADSAASVVAASASAENAALASAGSSSSTSSGAEADADAPVPERTITPPPVAVISAADGDLSTAFRSHAPGYWSEATPEQWNDWKWQLKNRVTTLEGLEQRLVLAPEERAGVRVAGSKLALAVTPHFFNLIERDNPNCPIRRQVLPRLEESLVQPWEMADPVGEDHDMPVPGLVHRYPDRVLFLVTDRCASYCRYCTRSRVVSGAGEQELHTNFEGALAYLREHTEVRDVLLSGGDPLLFTDDKLERILRSLREIPHIEFLRIGSRVPIFLPQRITPALCAMLAKYHPLWMSVHVNHPRELTVEVKAALERLANAGIPLGNQSVLLRGVNDDLDVMRALVHKLLRCRVRPYYLYQLDLIKGSSHLQVPVAKGLEIIEGLRGHTTGYAVPQYVIDAPGGGGKVPVNPNYLLYRDREKVVVRNYEGRIFEYPEAGAPREVLGAASATGTGPRPVPTVDDFYP